MHASSLVFVVIIAIWAAYLLPDQLRRRRRLESARTTDRDSTQMRVLVRRSPEDVAAQAVPAALPAGPTVQELGAGSAPALEAAPAEVPVPRVPVEAGAAVRTAEGARAGRVPAAPRRSGAHPARVRSSRVVRRRRRLVGALVALSAAGWTAAGLSVLPWFAAAVPTLLLLLVLAALARHAGAAVRPAPAPAARVEALAAVPLPVVAGEVLGSGEAVPAAAARRVEDGTWEPVPVPLPTYLLKPKAPSVTIPAPARRRVVVDVRPFDQDSAFPARSRAAAGDVVLDLREERRVANG
ncbi:hypothetical protein CLV92_104102 [Kineococcus xinjiangensis]|uniref:Uncharacterized protein n=1 Tax=Kineococcus xinjiangensis TaxID=512762 RepID=A0A2S6ISQ3_9ACTN|nr:hypothetical protein [Kineococcus xinjiangensis]PPK97283.1 hypothetical protein CLV92_104102 [Kineococcus xinjiangensis]